MARMPKSYLSDLTDEEWALVAPHLTLIREDAPRRVHSLRNIFTALRWMARSGSLLTLPAARVSALAGRLLAYRALDRSGPL